MKSLLLEKGDKHTSTREHTGNCLENRKNVHSWYGKSGEHDMAVLKIGRTEG